MYVKYSNAIVPRLIFLVLFIVVSKAACGSSESEMYSQVQAGSVSLPLRISPVMVDAPPRRIDLLSGDIKGLAVIENTSAGGNVSLQLGGFPVDLYEFPQLKIDATNLESESQGIELAIDTSDKGVADTLVRVGDPAVFSDLLSERIDLRTTVFEPRNLKHKILQLLGFLRDSKWRYTGTNVKVNEISGGQVSASFRRGGMLFIQRAFKSLDVESTPLVGFEYELPKGLPWVMVIAAKISQDGFNPIRTTLVSESVRGGGKKKFVINLHDLLQKSVPNSKGGRLEELIIHFELEETAKEATTNATLSLGKLEFYRSQITSGKGGSNIYLVSSEVKSGTINLTEALKRKTKSINKLKVVSGRLVGSSKESLLGTEAISKISLVAAYHEKVPQLFVGENSILDELSGAELSSILDRRVFIDKQMLWESGQSDVVFRNMSDPAHPLLAYALDARLKGDVYIKSEFLFEDKLQYPLRLTLSGVNEFGRLVEQVHVMFTNHPIRIEGIKVVRKLVVSILMDSGAIPPASFLIKKIQLFALNKSSAYSPKQVIATVVLVHKPLWVAGPARLDVNMPVHANTQTIRSYSVESKSVGDFVIKHNFEPVVGGGLTYFLKVKVVERGKFVEKLISLSRPGEIYLAKVILHGVDIVAKRGAGGESPARSFLILKQLEIGYKGGEAGAKEVLKPVTSGANTTYLTQHRALYAPELAWLRTAYEEDISKLNIKFVHKLDATLTLPQILEGGRTISLPDMALDVGGYELKQEELDGISVAIEPTLQLIHDQQTLETEKPNVLPPSSSRLDKTVYLILVVGLILLGAYMIPKCAPIVDNALHLGLVFWSVQFMLLSPSLYILLISAFKDALSWGGVLLTIAFGIAVRYKIRPYLIMKKISFAERNSAPYFLLFLALLVYCVALLVLKLHIAAERTAVLGYFILLLGVAVEFIQFAKGPAKNIVREDAS